MVMLLSLGAKIATGLGVLLLAWGSLMLWGHHKYDAGIEYEKGIAAIEQHKIELTMQRKVDDANAKFNAARLATTAAETAKDAALATQAARLADAKTNVAGLNGDVARLNGLLQHYADNAASAPSPRPVDSQAPKWRRLFGECVGRVAALTDSLGRLSASYHGSEVRFSQVAGDAAKGLDEINGWQGYALALQAGSK
jgi:hypothetical protein